MRQKKLTRRQAREMLDPGRDWYETYCQSIRRRGKRCRRTGLVMVR